MYYPYGPANQYYTSASIQNTTIEQMIQEFFTTNKVKILNAPVLRCFEPLKRCYNRMPREISTVKVWVESTPGNQ